MLEQLPALVDSKQHIRTKIQLIAINCNMQLQHDS